MDGGSPREAEGALDVGAENFEGAGPRRGSQRRPGARRHRHGPDEERLGLRGIMAFFYDVRRRGGFRHPSGLSVRAVDGGGY